MIRLIFTLYFFLYFSLFFFFTFSVCTKWNHLCIQAWTQIFFHHSLPFPSASSHFFSLSHSPPHPNVLSHDMCEYAVRCACIYGRTMRWLENGWKSRAEFQRSQMRRLFAVKIKQKKKKKKKKIWLSLSIHSSQEEKEEEEEEEEDTSISGRSVIKDLSSTCSENARECWRKRGNDGWLRIYVEKEVTVTWCIGSYPIEPSLYGCEP